MPKILEGVLAKTAKRRHYGKRRTAAYIYGTLRKLGWRPKRTKRRRS